MLVVCWSERDGGGERSTLTLLQRARSNVALLSARHTTRTAQWQVRVTVSRPSASDETITARRSSKPHATAAVFHDARVLQA
jgi:hypothetical protein